MTKTYTKQAVAKQMATKATKKDGKTYTVVAVEGGWTFQEVVTQRVPSARTNVVGRCSGGNWLVQTLKFLEAKHIDSNTVAITYDDKKVWVGDATQPRMFWFTKADRAEAVVARLAA